MMPSNDYPTRIRVSRWTKPDVSDEYPDSTKSTVADGVRGAIDYASGSLSASAIGVLSTSIFFLTCEPCDMRANDEVEDLSTGQKYTIEQAHHVTDPSMPHVRATMQISTFS